MLTAWAQATPGPTGADGKTWAEVFGRAPGGWALLVVAATVAFALAGHLGYVLAEARGAPEKLTEALTHAIEAGNYQEAWEACGRWRSAFLARILQPALERIGQGKERVDAALERKFSRERRLLTSLSWALIAIGGGVPVLCFIVAWAGFGALFRVDRAGVDARILTQAAGNFALFAAAAFAVVATSGVLWIGFRRRAAEKLPAFREDAGRFLRNLAYEDLEGLRIGPDFDAGTILGGGEEIQPTGRLRVSRELTTACPACNAPINPSRNPCPYCGAPFEWS